MGNMFSWLNEPAAFSGDANELHLTTKEKTDFWQQTFYGFERDNGHAYLTPVSGDFTASVTVCGDYQQLYDQAGLMLRIDPQQLDQDRHRIHGRTDAFQRRRH